MGLTTRARRIAAAATTVAAAGLAIGVSAFAQAAPGSRAQSPVVVCNSGGMVVWMNIPGTRMGSTVRYVLHFTNLTGSSCTLNGFPFIDAANLAGSTLGNPAVPDGHLGTPHLVTLGKGKTANATLVIVKVSTFTRSSCKPVTAAGLDVLVPTGLKEIAKVVPIPFRACTTFGRQAPHFMKVGAVH
jgi:hypothetical protein